VVEEAVLDAVAAVAEAAVVVAVEVVVDEAREAVMNHRMHSTME
jgi:hypothetical protein